MNAVKYGYTKIIILGLVTIKRACSYIWESNRGQFKCLKDNQIIRDESSNIYQVSVKHRIASSRGQRSQTSKPSLHRLKKQETTSECWIEQPNSLVQTESKICDLLRSISFEEVIEIIFTKISEIVMAIQTEYEFLLLTEMETMGRVSSRLSKTSDRNVYRRFETFEKLSFGSLS